MNPVYVDLHIHTSKDPTRLVADYDLPTLQSRVAACAEGAPILLSFTDHNTINAPVYLKAADFFQNVLIGVELHVRNYEEADPYHCHMYFRDTIGPEKLSEINALLDALYPCKTPTRADDIPSLEKIVRTFDRYEFLMLPHGGQSHSTFNESIPDGVQFDTAIERSVYYNHFDGFTARSDAGLDQSINYFKRLGIADFINLITSSDNYCPADYPQAKDPDAPPFVRTWLLAEPTFNGLRLSLSESDRLRYGAKPDAWAQYIRHASLKNEHIDIDVVLTAGLNVVIGGSSSGKTLLVDSIVRCIKGDFQGSSYGAFGVEQLDVDNPPGQTPHYLHQNYIISVCDQKDHENTLADIDLLRDVFPDDSTARRAIALGISELRRNLNAMVSAAAVIAKLDVELTHIAEPQELIVTSLIRRNPLKYLKPADTLTATFDYDEVDYNEDVRYLQALDRRLRRNPFIQHNVGLVEALLQELQSARLASETESRARAVIERYAGDIDAAQIASEQETTWKRRQFGKLLRCIRLYRRNWRIFRESRDKIAGFRISKNTKTVESMGHKLYIVNEFELTPSTFLGALNSALKREYELDRFDQITPGALKSDRFKKKNPQILDHDGLLRYVMAEFEKMNRKSYRIETSQGKEFDKLSAGWKTAVILDLILGSQADNAPLIIDQPEDNLATSYINSGLLRAIRASKRNRQIILVSHNATIPMLGDAQNVIYCVSEDQKITIRSSPLEGSIGAQDTVDLIAITTDGGKASIKKRVKKYNLKGYRGEDEPAV